MAWFKAPAETVLFLILGRSLCHSLSKVRKGRSRKSAEGIMKYLKMN